ANGNPTFQGVQFGSASPHVSQRIPANYQSSSRPATRKGSGPGGDGPAPRLFSVRPDQTGARPRNASAIKAITAGIRNRKNRTLAAVYEKSAMTPKLNSEAIKAMIRKTSASRSIAFLSW